MRRLVGPADQSSLVGPGGSSDRVPRGPNLLSAVAEKSSGESSGTVGALTHVVCGWTELLPKRHATALSLMLMKSAICPPGATEFTTSPMCGSLLGSATPYREQLMSSCAAASSRPSMRRRIVAAAASSISALSVSYLPMFTPLPERSQSQ